MQINLEVDDVQKLLDSQHKELTIDELIEMHEQQILKKFESLDPVQSDQMILTGGPSLIENRATNFRKY
ncbi:hypothetical protein TNCV_2122991 [Trichonephila clavipes]|nr:hypothetical protein TNCV_2122991 [Trichonephila clavipes]